MTHAQFGPSLVYPLGYVNSTTPVPMGIASYGLYNITNDSGPYQIETSEILGYAKINSMSAYNASPPVNVSAFGATLQLNAVINITATNGKNYSYWAQDVIDLNTSNSTYTIGDNVWNMSDVIANVSNATAYGYGNVSVSSSPFYNGTINETFYSYFINESYPYKYPVYFIPAMKVEVLNGKPVLMFGYKEGKSYVYYDNVTFNIPARRAYFLVTPYYYTPGVNSSSFYDSEFVIGGEGSGAISMFTNTNVTLWMGYLNGSSIDPFPAVATFGLDTAEAATGLGSLQYGGNASVREGVPNLNATLYLSGVPGALSLTNSTGTPVTTPSLPPPTSYTSIMQNSSSASSNSGSPISISSSTYYAIILVVFLVIAYSLVKSKRKPPSGSGQVTQNP